MTSRIHEKIEEIEEYVADLEEIKTDSFEEYLENKEKKAACERYAEKIIEAAVDLAFLVVSEKNLKTPMDDLSSFSALADENTISLELSTRLRQAKGMRNIIAHEYGKVDDKIVFEAIKEELINDVNLFIGSIKRALGGSKDNK